MLSGIGIFECGVIKLSKAQEKELRSLNEEPMLMKLGLSIKFLRNVMHSRKSALGIVLLLPSIVIASKKLKLCIGSRRREENSELSG